MIPKTRKGRIGTAVAATAIAFSGLLVAHAFGPPPPPSISPPGTIDSTCATNVTVALNAWLATVPTNSTVIFPLNGCYLINAIGGSGGSSPPANEAGAFIHGWNNITLDGNGTTLKQTVYDQESANESEPLLNLTANTGVQVQNLHMLGPASGSGENTEGDYGITLYGNTDVIVTNVSVTNVDGDNFTVQSDDSQVTHPINFGITISNSTFTNPGYHGSTVQGVVGFTFANNTMSGGNDIVDMEFDGGGTCWESGVPACGGEANILYTHNLFTHTNGTPEILGCQCTGSGPDAQLATNWSFTANTFGPGSAPTVTVEGGMSNQAGAPATNLIIQGNVYAPASPGIWSSGTGGDPDFSNSGQAPFTVRNWNNVSIQSNRLYGYDGALPATDYNTPTWMAGAALFNVNGASIKNNWFSGLGITHWQGPILGPQINVAAWTNQPPGIPPGAAIPDTNVTACNNAYGYNFPDSTGIGTVPPPGYDGAC